jgi:hypothetical protein
MTAKERRMCAGKIRHRTAVAAGKHAEALWQRQGEWVHPYRCAYCHGFHVGH